jgi:hypothetical protein
MLSEDLITSRGHFLMDEMIKITNSNKSHQSYRKYKSENGHTRITV